MSRIRAYGNKETELALVSILRRHHVTGWRRQIMLSVHCLRNKANHSSNVINSNKNGTAWLPRLKVKPDFVIKSTRIAIFVDGCFWHVCPKHANLPTNNRPFWKTKFDENRKRDRKVNRILKMAGWSVIRIWEHELKPGNEMKIVARIQRAAEAPSSGRSYLSCSPKAH